MLLSIGLIDGEISLSMLFGMLAGPFVLLSFKDRIMLLISVVVVGAQNYD